MYALALLCQHAMALTLLLVRTYAAAYGRQVALVVDYPHGITKIAHRQLMYPVRYVMAYRTPFLALRYLAMQAALGLVNGLKHGVPFIYFVKKLLLFFHFQYIFDLSIMQR